MKNKTAKPTPKIPQSKLPVDIDVDQENDNERFNRIGRLAKEMGLVGGRY